MENKIYIYIITPDIEVGKTFYVVDDLDAENETGMLLEWLENAGNCMIEERPAEILDVESCNPERSTAESVMYPLHGGDSRMPRMLTVYDIMFTGDNGDINASFSIYGEEDDFLDEVLENLRMEAEIDAGPATWSYLNTPSGTMGVLTHSVRGTGIPTKQGTEEKKH